METNVEGLFCSEYCGTGLMGGKFASHGLVMVGILALIFSQRGCTLPERWKGLETLVMPLSIF